MLCPKCTKVFKEMGLPAYRLMIKACHAFDQKGYLETDLFRFTDSECIRYLENKGYLVTTERGEHVIAITLDAKSVLYVDPGYYCWCHLHVEANDE